MKTNLPPYEVDKRVLSRFDCRRTVFSRIFWDKNAHFYGKQMYDKVAEIISENQGGYSRIEFAQMLGAWSVYDYFHHAFSWKRPKDANNVMTKPVLEKYSRIGPSTMSKKVKQTAKLYGASLVGICEIDHRWVYSHNYEGSPIEIPKEYEYAVVMGIEMDWEAIKTSPSFPASTASALGYSKMAFCIACLAEFIRNLGYKAIPMGNDTALSIPLAIDAGLGELGRNGLLTTPQYGSCVRLCKVFTDLSLEPDKPREMGVTDFCKRCKKCAEACEADAIQTDTEPTYEVACPSNNRGILRWPVNHDKCYSFWVENGADCSTCIAVCPYTHGNETTSE